MKRVSLKNFCHRQKYIPMSMKRITDEEAKEYIPCSEDFTSHGIEKAHNQPPLIITHNDHLKLLVKCFCEIFGFNPYQ